LIDSEKLSELRDMGDGKDDFLLEMLDKYIARAGEQITEATGLLGEGDAAKLQKVIHSLKGSTLSLGLSEAAKNIVDFDKELKAGDLSRAAERIDKIGADLARVQDYRKTFS